MSSKLEKPERIVSSNKSINLSRKVRFSKAISLGELTNYHCQKRNIKSNAYKFVSRTYVM